MKKAVWGVIAFLFLFLLMTSFAVAESSGNCGDVHWVLDDEGVLTLSGMGGCYATSGPWGTGVKKVVIEENVSGLYASAFSNCTSLTEFIVYPANEYLASIDGILYSRDETRLICCPARKKGIVTIPETVTTIGSHAFENYSSSYNLEIPDTVTKIEQFAFRSCFALNEITIPDGTKSIENGAFYYCINLSSVTIPESVTYIGNDAFYYCGLRRIEIPGNVYIDNYAFDNCQYVEQIELSNGVYYIGDYAFAGCATNSVIQPVSIPGSVKNIGKGAFASSYAQLSNASGLTEVIIEDGVQTIGEDAFSSCKDLLSVSIPDSVTSIGNNAFSGCSKMQSISIPASVTAIGTNAFTKAYSQKPSLIVVSGSFAHQYAIDNGYQYTANQVFDYTISGNQAKIIRYNGADESLTVPTQLGNYPVVSIEAQAFRDRTNLKRVTLLSNITNIGQNAFQNCNADLMLIVEDKSYSLQYAIDYNIPYQIDWAKVYIASYSNGEAILIKYNGNETEVTIPEYINGYPVTGINGTFSGNKQITKVTIPNGIRTIGNNTFYQCTNLKIVSIPESVTCIGKNAFTYSGLENIIIPGNVEAIEAYAFSNCSSLTNVTISHGVTSIGPSAFEGCSHLTSVIMPESVTRIEESTFESCNNLTEISIPSSITFIGDRAFFRDEQLTDLIIPNNVKRIGDWAFAYCGGLTNFIIPEGVTSIGGELFYQCNNLTSITIPDSLCSIGEKSNSFAWCSRLTEIHISSTNEHFTLVDGILYNASMTELICCIPQKTGAVVIPNSVTTIYSHAFSLCNKITQINIPDSVDNIGSFAFENCNQLSRIIIPYGVSVIEEHTFFACSGLTYVSIPNSITRIDNYAFSSCSKLASIFIPDSVTSIGNNAFNYCSALKEIRLPANLTTIAKSAFSSCTAIESIFIPEKVKSIQEYAFENCKALRFISLPSSLQTIAGNAFYYSYSSCAYTISKVYYAGTETEWEKIFIGDNPPLTDATKMFNSNGPAITASGDCGDESSWTLDETGVLSIIGTGEMTSHPWTAGRVKKIIISNGITSICDEALSGCSNLWDITIPDSVTSIGNSAFYGCNNLTSIDLPDNLISIGNSVFYNCSKLTRIDIPDGVASIGTNAFTNCNAKRYAEIGAPAAIALSQAGYSFIPHESIFSILYQFVDNTVSGVVLVSINDKTITSFEFPEYITSIGASAFNNCSSLVSINIPENVTSIGASAFSGCSKLNSITFPDGITNAGSSVFSGINYIAPNSSTALAFSKSGNSFVPIGTTIKIIHTYNGDQITGTSLVGVADNTVTEIVIPDYITSIGASAFSGCNNLSYIDMQSGIPKLIDTSFSGCPQSVTLRFPNDSINLNGAQFGICGNHAIYVLKNGAFDVYGSGDMRDYSLEKYIVNTYYSNYSYHYDYAYRSTTPWNSSTINSVTIHYGITSIGLNAFSGKALTSLTISSSVRTIGENAFSNCNGLVSITIPSSVSEINKNAFSSCHGLTDIFFEGNAPTFGTTVFSGVISNVYYTPNSTWQDKIQNYGGNLTWIKPGAECGTNTVWVLDDLSVLRFHGSGIVSEATWTKYASGITTLVIAPDLGGIDSNVLTNLSNLEKIVFEGDPPEGLASDAFAGITANAYYSHSNSSWIEDAKLNYGGSLNWQRYCTHSGANIDSYEAVYCEETAPMNCVTNGHVTHWKCSLCGLAFVDEELTQRMADEDLFILAPGHSLVVFPGQEATCTATGLTDGVFCEVCGETIQEQEEIPLAPHTDSVSIEAIPATCISVGYTAEHRCAVCGVLLAAVEEVPFADHTDSISVAAVEPTCTAVGYTAEHKCAVCGIVLEEKQEIPMVPHMDSISVEAVEPTCSSVGYTAEHRCSVCNEILTAAEEIEKLPHTDSVTIEYLAPTCTAEGHTEEHTCSVCGEVIEASEAIPATGHTYNDPTTAWSENGKTCTFTFECEHEDDTKVIEVSAVGSVEVEPNCTETGTTLYTATTVLNEKTYSDTTTRDDIPAKGHNEVEDPAVDPTDRETGLKAGSHCSVCGITLVPQEVIPALWSYTDNGLTVTGYNGSETDLTIPDGVTTLGNTLFKNNTAITSVHIPSGVTALGTQTFFGATGLTDVWLPENLDGIGMQTFYNTTAVLHTSSEGTTAKGLSLRNRDFTDGDLTLRYKITSVTSTPTITYLIKWQGDDEDLIMPDTFGGAPETQIQAGAFADKTQLKSIVVPDNVSTIAADAFDGCSEDLVILSSMTAYAKTWAENNNITWAHYPHTEVADEAIAPTCTEPGKTEGKHCSECGEIITAQEKIPALSHEWGEPTYEWNEDNSKVTATRVCTHDASHAETETIDVTSEVTKAATCEAKGETTYTSAMFDNAAFTVQTKTVEDVPVLGHEWGEPTYEWNEDNSKVTATRVCTHDEDHKETETADVTSEITKTATCEAKGETTYASATFDNAAFTVQMKTVEDVPVLGHEWGEPTYAWNEDNSKVAAIRVCGHDNNHTETEEVDTVRELVTAPTDQEAGSYQIISKTFENTAFEVQTKTDLVIPALESMNVLKLPAFLTTIETEAFDGIATEAIIIPDGCTTIEPRAFINCKNLLYVRIPSGIEVPEDAFTECPNVVIDQR